MSKGDSKEVTWHNTARMTQVNFYTNSDIEEIKRVVFGLEDVTALSVELPGKALNTKPKMSDRNQIIIIWLLAIISILAMFLFIEWSTRP